MIRTLPFTALRTFEAVVRLSGFARAAEELNVTQSAVSQHVKAVEEWVGQTLLIRGARKTVATEAGARLATAVAEGLGTIQAVCDDLRGRNRDAAHSILVAAPPGFAFVWLLPRLIRFDQINPGIPVSLLTDQAALDTRHAGADVTIHYGRARVPGMYCARLLSETMSPVCTPALAETLRHVDDLARHTILHDSGDTSGMPSNWVYWADALGLRLPVFGKSRKFGQANLVIQAAMSGMGVAMGRSNLVEDAIAEGRLVRPLPLEATSEFSYWFTCAQGALKSPDVQVFRDWLFAEAEGLGGS